MKKIYGLAALCAAMTLASCSNENEPQVVGPQTPDEVAYISLNLLASNEGDTREDPSDNSYTNGTTPESAVGTGVIFSFDTDGKLRGIDDFTPRNFTSQTEGNNVSHKSTNKAIKVSYDKNHPTTQVLVVLNKQASDFSSLYTSGVVNTNNTIIDVRGIVDDYAFKGNENEKFVMSHSVYVPQNATNASYTVAVTPFQDIQNADLKEATEVYVERVAARVDYKDDGITSTGVSNKGITKPRKSIDGAEAGDLDVVITGVTIANVANKSYLVKDLDKKGTESVFNPTDASGFFKSGYQWNVYGDNRSHWAYTPTNADGFAYKNKDYYTIAGVASSVAADQKDANVGAYTFPKEGTTPKWTPTYVLENTNDAQPTCVLVTAKVGDGNDIYRSVADGKYYSAARIKKAYLSYLETEKYAKKKGNTVSTLDENDLEIVSTAELAATGSEYASTVGTAHGYDGYIQIKASLTTGADPYTVGIIDDWNDPDSYDVSDVETLNKALINATTKAKDKVENGNTVTNRTVKKYRVYKWNKGYSYYFVNIKPETVGHDGVVRNHIYALNLQSLIGMGVPVFDPKEVIVPETPDPVDPDDPEEWYIKANINILSWKYYTQGVNFNNGND